MSRNVDTSLIIKSTSEDLIDAFVNPRTLKQWWLVEKSLIEPKVGGAYTLIWNINANGVGYVMSGSILAFNPKSQLIITNLVYINPQRPVLGPMTLTVEASTEEGLTKLYICQDGYGKGEDWDWYYDAVKKAWPLAIDNLKQYIEKEEAERTVPYHQ